ncbi:DUF1707 SHOCT-like domain-containing protein [Nocardia sp. NPDC055165]|uniref:DUF1707 SHOCT-like domain-containing protein n=1 Tax=Nocardia sp. NPDC060220 TaxID=3347076 RepID=UPI00366A0BB1
MSKKPDQLRARDADRADVCAVIDAASADGQLTADEHAARSAQAMRAETFASLDRLIDDLQLTDEFAAATPTRGADRTPRRWWIPVLAILTAGVVGAVAGLIGRAAADEALPDLTTADGLAYFLAEYRAEFGATTLDEATVYPGYVSFERVGASGKQDSYVYRGDFDSSGTPAARPAGTPAFDLAAIDLARFAPLVAGAPQTTEVPRGRVAYLGIGFAPGAEADAEPLITVYVRNDDDESGRLELAFDGEPRAIRPLTP